MHKMTIPTENDRDIGKQFPLPADIDWSSLSLADPPKVNGHVECSYDASTGKWSTPELIASPYIQVHGLAPGLNYGQQVYEGLKAFRTAENTLHIFRPEAHAARMRHSANMVCLPEVSNELFLECVRLAVASNAEFVPPADSAGFLYLRPVLFGSGAQIALAPSNKTILAIYVIPGGAYHGTDALDALIMEDFDRSAPRGTGSGKLGGNYAPAWPHQARARQRGFGLTLHLDSETRSQIEEFSTSGFVGVEGASKTICVPDTHNAIHSITSESLTSVAKQEGWAIQHCAIPFNTLGRFSEVFAVGTAATAVPIRSILRDSTGERFEFGNAVQGKEIIQKLSGIQRGTQPDEFNWRWNVYPL